MRMRFTPQMSAPVQRTTLGRPAIVGGTSVNGATPSFLIPGLPFGDDADAVAPSFLPIPGLPFADDGDAVAPSFLPIPILPFADDSAE